MELITLINNNKQSLSQHQAHHVILGAGLIGCYLGGALLNAKQKVSFVAKPAFSDQLEKQLHITDYHNNQFTAQPSLDVIHPNDLDRLSFNADILWVTVKCLALDAAISDIAKCITSKTLIICCQNGIANHVHVQQAFVHNHVIRAMVPFNVVNDAAGHFHRGSQGHLTLECTSATEDSVKWLARQIDQKLLPTDTTYNMTALQWAKLQLNLGNAVNALANMPVKQMLETKVYRVVIAKMMLELLQVSEKKQIKLPKIANLPNKWIPKILLLPNFLFTRVAQSMLAVDPTVRTSMWWDLQAGKQTEVDFINAKVVDVAKQIGVETPINKQIVAFIKQAELGDSIDEASFYEWACKVSKDG
ncbi:MAG: 2-dehydropantoate 2-reductase [Glaciecola sp.]